LVRKPCRARCFSRHGIGISDLTERRMASELLMRPHSSIHVVALVAIAIVINAWTGERAHAGCGDYLIIRPSGSADLSGMASHVNNKPADSPKPCRGPHCSAHRLPESPPMTPPISVATTASDLALASLWDFISDSHLSRRNPQSSNGDPIHRPTIPFHPPRIAR
jgi:hypothetical protein